MQDKRLGSLFDGSGGFPLAASLCGIEPVWASEVEPYPIAVTRSRFPTMKHLGDISKVNGAEIEPVDVITFGSPCQDLSVAGKRAGLKHEANGDEETTRSGLFIEAVRIIKEMREATNGKYPTFALWENVPGAFSSNKGEDFRIVLEELIKIVEPTAVMPAVPKKGWAYADSYSGDGWSIAYRVFDAQYWGVPQRRRRIHLVLDLRGERAGEVLFKSEGLRGHHPSCGSPWQKTAGDAENRIGADDREGDCVGFDSYNLCETGEVGRTVTTPSGGLNEHIPCVYYSDDHVPYTLKIRGGVEVDSAGKSAGKGALIQTNLSATLGVSQDQYLFQPVSIENHPADSRVNLDESGKVQTLTSRMGTGGGNVPMVMEAVAYNGENITSPLNKANPQPGDPCHTLGTDSRNYAVYCLQGNGIDRADTAGCNGKGWREDACYTLNTIDRPAVVYAETYQKATGPLMANSHPGSYTGQDAYNDMFVVGKECPVYSMKSIARNGVALTEQANPICASDYKDPDIVAHPVIAPTVRYIVRRLTPIECARLQGFADQWGDIEQKHKFTEEEYQFWLEVRNTHAAINGKVVKDYTKKQMLTWYNKLHTDSAEYKMWGNGIALPPALYCMQGIKDALEGR